MPTFVVGVAEPGSAVVGFVVEGLYAAAVEQTVSKAEKIARRRYPRGAVNGARILIGERTYAVIGAVSASHIIVEVGDEPTVSVDDVATLVGPDHPDVYPNEVARASSGSVYDIFMHLNPALPASWCELRPRATTTARTRGPTGLATPSQT